MRGYTSVVSLCSEHDHMYWQIHKYMYIQLNIISLHIGSYIQMFPYLYVLYAYTKGFTAITVYVLTAATGCRHNEQKKFIFRPMLDLLKSYNYAPIYLGMCVYILHIKLYVHGIK